MKGLCFRKCSLACGHELVIGWDIDDGIFTQLADSLVMMRAHSMVEVGGAEGVDEIVLLKTWRSRFYGGGDNACQRVATRTITLLWDGKCLGGSTAFESSIAFN